MDWNVTTLLLATVFVSMGALLQAVTGLGAGLVIVPLLALISLELIPGPMIFGSLVLSGAMAFYGRHSISKRNLLPILLGVLTGTCLAAYYLSTLALESLGLVFGIFILAAVLISVVAPVFSFGVKGSLTAGFLAGFMGTSAGIGAPVLALLYQNHDGAALRSTLALLYFVSSILMLGVLHVFNRFGVSEMISGLYLIPGFVLGFYIDPYLMQKIDKGYARPAVLIISIVSALVLIGRSF